MLRGDWDDALQTALAPVIGLLEDENVTEIEANAWDEIWIKTTYRAGHHRVAEVGWRDADDFQVACSQVSRVIGRRINQASPILNARLPDGSRVNIVVPPACARTSLTVRKFPADTMTLDRLEQLGTIDARMKAICKALVLARKSIIVGGGTSAGKTSLLNALSREIPSRERIVTIEDARELQICQPNWVALETVEPITDGDTPVTIGDLVRNALRQTPDRIIVGEVRGEEALSLLRAFSTGHGGGFGTLHCNDALDALHQLQILAQMSPVALPAHVVASLVERAVDVVVYQKYFDEENVRRITEIAEVEHGSLSVTESGVAYKLRHLVRFEEGVGWTFPQEPSESLRKAVERRGGRWPEGERRADRGGMTTVVAPGRAAVGGEGSGTALRAGGGSRRGSAGAGSGGGGVGSDGAAATVRGTGGVHA